MLSNFVLKDKKQIKEKINLRKTKKKTEYLYKEYTTKKGENTPIEKRQKTNFVEITGKKF